MIDFIFNSQTCCLDYKEHFSVTVPGLHIVGVTAPMERDFAAYWLLPVPQSHSPKATVEGWV